MSTVKGTDTRKNLDTCNSKLAATTTGDGDQNYQRRLCGSPLIPEIAEVTTSTGLANFIETLLTEMEGITMF